MANLTPNDIRRINVGLSEFLQEELSTQPAAILRLCNTAEELPDGMYKWRLSVNSPRSLSKVVFHLHPTFQPQVVVVNSPDFAIERTGWGTFVVTVDCFFQNGEVRRFHHELSFDGKETCHTLPARRAMGPEELKLSKMPRNTMMSVQAEQAARAYIERFGEAPSTKSDLARLYDEEQRLEENPSRQVTPSPQVKCMEGVDEASMHGRMGIGRGWLPPRVAMECDQRARPNYASELAHEYQEEKSTLQKKVSHLAQLLRSANHCVAYTGAGISTASGIDDYASKGRNSLATGDGVTGTFRPKASKGLDAEPTFSHYCLSALQKEGMVHSWVQQNHDGLPQKARFPQNRINEIHGAWFDPSNPVVPMDGTLRGDLYQRMLADEKKADLCLTIGTSLCGMNADRIVSRTAQRYCKKGKGHGSVIIGFQRTPLDSVCSLRIFARIDEVMLLLARELNLTMGLTPYRYASSGQLVYTVPYKKDGTKSTSSTPSVLDLRVGAKIKLTGGPGKGYLGTVVRAPHNGRSRYGASSASSWCVQFPCTRENSPEQGKLPCLYALGGWMVDAAVRGELDTLPIVNA